MARNENASMAVQPIQPRKGILQLGNNDASLAEQKILSQQIASLNAKLDKMQLSIVQVNSVNWLINTNQDASLRNLEERTKGKFPSNTIVNPREECKSIVTRSRIVITSQEKQKVVQKKKADEPVIEPEQEKEEELPATEEPATKDKEEAKEKVVENPKKRWDFSRFEKKPYSIKSKQYAQKQQHARFLEIFKMALIEECSAIIQKKFPPKLRDPGSFNIPIAIGNINVGHALCDLGASINLMPLSVMKSVRISELKPTMVSLQLADRTLRRPNGVIEDVLVKVDKFIFPADFVVLDMEEEGDMPLLLGRPFLATARAMIDTEKGKLELRMDDEKVTINVFSAMKHAEDNGDCFRVDIIEKMFLEKKYDHTIEEEKEFFDENLPKEDAEIPMEEMKKKESDITTEAPKVELKELPPNLKYVFLVDKETYLVIINK
ncbi:uncharacterized protein LOC133318067 [Gastrolobium bilobum]|uniref:uncharacterized protein LOC133318067 n=1 Tax=Gastrolobium bilobum TaxID=150636 RepID=UPI002AB01C45|nr:uncharacterized protein LOC133318067 [Gastrolobium bilobum]